MPSPSTPPEKVIAELRQAHVDWNSIIMRRHLPALLAVAEAAVTLLPCIQGSVAEDEVEALAAALAALGEGGGETPPKDSPDIARLHQAHWQSCNCLSMTDKCCRADCPCHSLPEEVPDAERH